MNLVNRNVGFTLIEVLVAVAIFAIMATAVQKTISVRLQISQDLENITIASWIAQNKLNEARFSPDNTKGKKQTSVEMAARTWRVTTEFETTKNDSINRIDVNVALKNDVTDEHEPYYTLSGFVINE